MTASGMRWKRTGCCLKGWGNEMDKMSVYGCLPVWGQNLACTLQGAVIRKDRYSPYFDKLVRQFRQTGKYSFGQIREYQDRKLKKLLIHCYETVPFYRKEFDECGFNPYRFRHADEMAVLPVITKDVLKNRLHDFISKAGLPSKTYIHLTGGTTGKSIPYYKTLHEQSKQWAVWWRYRNNLGIRIGDWCGEFGSKPVVPHRQKKPPYWRTDYTEHRRLFSPYHLNADTIQTYARGLSGIKWVHGYTSKLADMAYWLVQNKMTVPMDFVTIGAENVYDVQKKIIEQAFGCCVYQHYGMTEGAVNISQMQDFKLRIDEDFCYTEFIRHGSRYHMTGTNLHYYRMPLIRYDTGDYGELSETQDGGFRIVKSLSGRESEAVTTNTGIKVTAAEFDEEIFAKISHMAQAQVVQKSRDELEIRVVKLDGYSSADEHELLRYLKRIAGENMVYRITYHGSLEKAENGKFKLIVNRPGGGIAGYNARNTTACIRWITCPDAASFWPMGAAS